MKILTVIGARPQIIKSAALSRAIKNAGNNLVEEVVVHTGQHYDQNMSGVFFQELEIAPENYNLKVGSGSHAVQTANMLIALEEVILSEKPDYLLLYGDTNSTLAGAIVAAKLDLPIVHVEAGVRARNKTNVEELNRIVTDHFSSLLFYYTPSALHYLEKEGFESGNVAPFHINNPGLYQCGDVMYDNAIYFRQKAQSESQALNSLGLTDKPFILATVHRDINTDTPARLLALMQAFDTITRAHNINLVLPMHPRTTKMIAAPEGAQIATLLAANKLINVTAPATYLDMVLLESNANLILTDSGGVQREAYFFGKPCVILNTETPWPELLDNHSTLLGGSTTAGIVEAFNTLWLTKANLKYPPIFGNGHAAEDILEALLANHESKKIG